MKNLIILLSGLLSSLAQAQEWAIPIDEVEPVKVQWDMGVRSYHPLPAGASLSFDTPGPMRLAVELRVRLPAGEPLGTVPSLEARGDGNLFMTIQADAISATEGHIYDELGGTPSVASQAWLDVPEGGNILSLHADAAGPDFLVFLIKDTGSDVAMGDAPLSIPKASMPEDPWVKDLTSASSDVFDTEEDLPEVIEEEEPEVAAIEAEPALEPSTEGLDPGRSMAEIFENLEIGPRVGLGLPSWGSGAVPSLAARAYLPLIPDLGGVAVALGWYRLKYEDRSVMVDPYLGAQEIDWSWRTHVMHLSVEAAALPPLEFGPVQPIAGAGLDLYLARRVTSSDKTGGLAPGLHIYAGSRFMLPLGALEASLGWNGGRRGFDNFGQDNRPVRESLASTHLDISWMMELP